MAKSEKKKNIKEYIVTVENNDAFCGVGAGGTQFANGKATVKSERLANWFKEHKGYTVTAVEDDPEQ